MLTLLIASSVISCASAPKETKELTPSVQPPSLDISRKAAEETRAKALLIKAEVAAKVSFDLADGKFNAAKELESKGDAVKAQETYDEAAAAFKKAEEEASLKRDTALKAIKLAEEERKLSEQALLDAETAQTDDTAAKKEEAAR